MKKRFIEHLIRFTAVMSLCAAVLTGIPSGGKPGPEPGNGKPEITIENPGANNLPGNEPGIAPHHDGPLQQFVEE